MAFLGCSGFEVGGFPSTGGPDSQANVGTVTYSTTNPRTGTRCVVCDSTGANSVANIRLDDGDGSANKTNFMRVYLRFENFPSSTVAVIHFGDLANNGYEIHITSGGVVQLQRLSGGALTQVGSDGPTLSLSTYYCFELAVTNTGAGGQFAGAEARIDQTSFASETGQSLTVSLPACKVGWARLLPGASKVLRIDDYQFNDDSGSAPTNTWPGAGYVVHMFPLSDSQRGSWTGGAGGTTNLFECLNNFPPIGTATETDLTQIESADSSGDNATDEYRGDCGSYTTAGVGANDTVVGLQIHADHGEDVATNTKTGSFGPQANPSATYLGFTFGNDIGALGTWPTNWRFSIINAGVVIDNPTVTKGNSLILAARKTDTGTRVASLDALFAYVAVQTAAATVDVIPRRPAIYDQVALPRSRY